MASIESLMVQEMITVGPDDTVAEAVRRMSQNRVGAVVVVDGDELRGLFSERDLMNRVVAEQLDPQATKVGTVATREVVSIESDHALKEVLEIFRDKRFRHLPVVRAGKPVGILSTRDFLAYLVGGLERYIDDLRYRRELAEGVDPYDHVGGSYGR